MSGKLTEDRKQERETIIRFDETDAPATFYTASPVVATLWRNRGLAVRKIRRGTERIPTGWEAQAPKGVITIRRYQPMTEAKRAQLSAQGRAGWAKGIGRAAGPDR